MRAMWCSNVLDMFWAILGGIINFYELLKEVTFACRVMCPRQLNYGIMPTLENLTAYYYRRNWL